MLKKMIAYSLSVLMIVSCITILQIETVNGEENHGKGFRYVEPYNNHSESSTNTYSFRRAAPLPASYRSTVTSVKNQGNYGACWAFGMMNSAEASMIKNSGASTSIDYSEQQLAYFCNKKNVTDPLGLTAGGTNLINGNYMLIGGNNLMTAMMMSNWIGATEESKAPYGTLSLDDSLSYDDVAQLKNSCFFSKDETSEIKEYIQNQGSVNVAYYASHTLDAYKSQDYKGKDITTYYTDSKTEAYADHVVSIVGWDDNIPANLFKAYDNGHSPTHNGGWLIKNSWGTSFGDDGYFYISYEDTSLCEFIGAEFETANTYDNNYHYDNTGNATSGYKLYNGETMSNIYTVQGDTSHKEILSRVGFALASQNTNYSIQIYKNPQANQPESGKSMLATPTTGFIKEKGYFTVDIPEVTFTGGDTFSVAITLSTTNKDRTVYVFMDQDYSYSNGKGSYWVSGTINEEPGRAFVCDEDMMEYGLVNRIKAFTRNVESYSSKKSFSKAKIQSINNMKYTGSEVKPNPVVTYNGTTLTLNKDYKLTYKNNIQTGTGYVIASGIGQYTGFVSQTFTISENDWSVDNINSVTYTGNAITPAVTVKSDNHVLTKGKDYTVSYANNINAGTASVVVTGIGAYKGSKTLHFTIQPLSLSSATISSINPMNYTGSALYPSVNVTMGGKTLTGGTDYTLSYSQNINPGTGYVMITGKGNYTGTKTQSFSIYNANVSYRTHVQTYGWQGYVSNGQTSGTSGQSKRLEGINIKLDNVNVSGGITYRTHVQTYGWQGWKSDNEMAGTSGQSKRLEAIEIKLTGDMAKYYDLYYRVHAQQFGWLDWASNGASAGSAGYSYRLEAIQVKLVPKGSSAPGSTSRPYVQRYVSYQTHVQTYGWQGNVYDGTMSGTSGQSKRLEGIKINLENQRYAGSVQYKTHVQTYGWQNWVANGQMAGTSGQSKRLEAIQIKLTGDMANHYDVYYRVHVQQFGWLGWAKNGTSAGSAGYSYRLEGIQIILVNKGDSAPGNTSDCFRQR